MLPRPPHTTKRSFTRNNNNIIINNSNNMALRYCFTPTPLTPHRADPSCTLMIMQRGRSLDERMLANAEPRRRKAQAARGMLNTRHKQASMSNLESKPR